MESIKELYRIGNGPSSSHTIGPQKAAERFMKMYPKAESFKAYLYGSLAATGSGHMTDKIIEKTFSPKPVEIFWHSEKNLPEHPNGMEFQAVLPGNKFSERKKYFSVGGGAVLEEGEERSINSIYRYKTMTDILYYTEANGLTLWEYVLETEGEGIESFLLDIWKVMRESVERGIENEGVLPGRLKVPRKASTYYVKANTSFPILKRLGLAFSYALGVSEENASGNLVVTAPTCGSSGVLPAVLKLISEEGGFSERKIWRALATAGLIGNIIKFNASISGAEVGCQGEVGTACAMAAAACAQLLGGTPPQIEYAAEMGLEHHLGLTCDPILGYVQIPCIERNAIAATRALDCAAYALLSDGKHRISFDEVVETMGQTGRDMHESYRETSRGGLAKNAWRVFM